VMPQTLEAIDHAHAAEVPIIVAVNKIDKPDALPDRVKKQLADRGLMPEDWGGTTVFVDVSAKQKTNLNLLLEMVCLVADLQELKAVPDRPATGVVLEAKLDRGRGPVATLLVQNGTLHTSDNFVVGNVYGKIRAMFDDRGGQLEEAPPSTPVEILGIEGLPQAGDQGLDNTGTWGRKYWGGAMFCLLADIEIRKRTNNRRGLQDAMRGVLAAGGSHEQDWPIERILSKALPSR